MRRPRAIGALLALVMIAGPAGTGADAGFAAERPLADAWAAVEELRARLIEQSPVTADFSQTFTPAGFSTGDTETGLLALELPRCARWDYAEPFPKSFLLCDEIAYAWNPGETSGRRYRISADEREGLDLLRLDVEELRKRYAATGFEEEASYDVRLEPRAGETELAEATLSMTTDRSRLVSIAFSDRDGNHTLFEIGDLRPLDSRAALSPPADVAWLED